MAEGEKEGVREGLICISAGDANCWRPNVNIFYRYCAYVRNNLY